jgi:hypothetical protein
VLNGSSLALGFFDFYPLGETGFFEFYYYLLRVKLPVCLFIFFVGDVSNYFSFFLLEELGELPN